MEINSILHNDKIWNQWSDSLIYDEQFVYGAIIILSDKQLIGQVICYHNPFHVLEDSPCLTIGNINIPTEFWILEQIQIICTKLAKNIEAKYIISPMNGSTWNAYRFVSMQSNDPFMLEPTKEPFLYKGFYTMGYRKLAGYYSQLTDGIVDNWERCSSRYKQFIDNGVRFEGFDRAFAQKEFHSLAKLCNKAFRKNFLFSPLKEEDFVKKMNQILPLIDPQYTILAHFQDEVVGFIFAYHDQLNKEEKTLVIKTLARDIDGPFGGMGSVLSAIVLRKAIENGFTQSIHALMIDTNASTTISKNFNGKILSQYELLYISL